MARVANVHSRHYRGEDACVYVLDGPVGLQPVSAGKREYLRSEKHQAVYAEALGDKFCVGHAAGAPGRCTERLTPHHILPRSQAGGQEQAEAYPVVMLCDWLNDAVQSNPECRAWAETHYFHRNGRDWPFLMSAAVARETEPARPSRSKFK